MLMFGPGENSMATTGSSLPAGFSRSSEICYLDRTIATRHDADDLTHLFLPPLGQDIRQAAAEPASN
jgi:hypothetical protein